MFWNTIGFLSALSLLSAWLCKHAQQRADGHVLGKGKVPRESKWEASTESWWLSDERWDLASNGPLATALHFPPLLGGQWVLGLMHTCSWGINSSHPHLHSHPLQMWLAHLHSATLYLNFVRGEVDQSLQGGGVETASMLNMWLWCDVMWHSGCDGRVAQVTTDSWSENCIICWFLYQGMIMSKAWAFEGSNTSKSL